MITNLASMKHAILGIAILAGTWFECLYAQQLTPFVISPAGGFSTTNGGSLSYTVGELAAVETFTGTASILTQGFQQPQEMGTYIEEHPIENFSFGVYPNPSDGNFYLLTDTEIDLRYDIRILDILGREIWSKTYAQESKVTVEHIDISDKVGGMYFISLLVLNPQSQQQHTFIYKVNTVK